METASALLRRYINLLEGDIAAVTVSVERYIGIDQAPIPDSPFPASLTFKIDPTEDPDVITQTLKAEIQASTGYEPAKFSWRWAYASADIEQAMPQVGEADSP